MHTQQQLKLVSRIIKELDSISHPDSSRIANEIAQEYSFDEKQIDDVLSRISEGEPWEYIRGYALFRGLKFIVDKNVLIPRIETEQMVEIVIQLQKKLFSKRIVDVGTGSGAIICSLAHELRTETKFSAIEVSSEALKIAKANAKFLKLPQIDFRNNSLLDNFQINERTIIAANLPYVTSQDYKNLPDSVKDYEPKVALEGGEDGAVLIKKLLNQASLYKDMIDAIVLEMDSEMIEHVKKFAEETLKEFRVSSIEDFAQKQRFVVIER